MKKLSKDTWRCGPFEIWGGFKVYEIRLRLNGCEMTDYLKSYKTLKKAEKWCQRQAVKMFIDLLDTPPCGKGE